MVTLSALRSSGAHIRLSRDAFRAMRPVSPRPYRLPIFRIAATLILLLGARDAFAQIHTHHDTIPDFGAQPTIASVRAGNWSDPGTWGGRVPATGDVVRISANTAVRYDVLSNADIDTLSVEPAASLVFAENTNTLLRVVNFVVKEQGSLHIGTPASPIQPHVRAEVVFLDRPLDTAKDPFQWGNGLLVLGTVKFHGYDPGKTFVRLAEEVAAGAQQLVLSEPVPGWRIGDTVIIPDSTQHFRLSGHGNGFHKYSEQIERFTISSISPDGLRLRLSHPAAHLHPGARDRDGVIVRLPHVANLTRNVILRSENPNGTRAHTAFTHHASASIRFASFRGLGRTLNKQLDSTTLDGSGNVNHIGTNQVGRYGIHFHHAIQPGSEVVGCEVDGYVDEDEGVRAGIWIHSSNSILVSRNVVLYVAAWAIGTEKGNERWLTITDNYALNVRGAHRRPDGAANEGEPGAIGAAYWFRGGHDMVFANNVAANSTEGFNLFFSCCALTRAPKAPGLDPNVDGNWENLDPQAANFTVQGFEVHSSRVSFEWWDVSHNCRADGSIARTRIQDATVWHVGTLALNYPGQNVSVERLKIYDQLEKFDTTGMTLGDYRHPNFSLVDSEFQGIGGAAFSPSSDSGGGVQKIINTKFLNNGGAIGIPPQFTSGQPQWMPPLRILLKNVTVERPRSFPTGVQDGAQITTGGWYSQGVNNMVLQETRLENVSIDGRTISSFAYRPDQHPKFVVPASIVSGNSQYSLVAAPTIGLTNEQLLSSFGQAAAGAVAPCYTAVPRLGALVCDPPGGGEDLIMIEWRLRVRPNGGGGFDAFAVGMTNEPSILTFQANGNTYVSPAADYRHVLPIGSYAPGGEVFGSAKFTSGSRTVNVRADWAIVRTPALPDATAPSAYEFYAPAVTHSPTSALFTVRTNEWVLLRVEYGTTAALGQVGPQSGFFEAGGYDFGTVEATNLTPDTTYFAHVVMRDAGGNETRQPMVQFKTAKQPSGSAPAYGNVELATDRNKCVDGAVAGPRPQGTSYMLHSVPWNGAVHFRQDGSFTYVPFPDGTGLDSFQYRVVDPEGRVSAPATVTVSVNGGLNGAPEIDPIPTIEVTQGDRVTYQVSARSPIGRPLGYALFGNMPAAIGQTTGLMDFTVGLNQAAGSYVMTVEVRDDRGEQSSRSFVLKVNGSPNNPNDPSNPNNPNNPNNPTNPGDGTILSAPMLPSLTVSLNGRKKLTVPFKFVIAYNAAVLKAERVRKMAGLYVAAGPAPAKLRTRKLSIKPSVRKKAIVGVQVLTNKITVTAPGRYVVAFAAIGGLHGTMSSMEVNVNP